MDWPRKFRDPENRPGRDPVRLALWALSVLPLLVLGVAVWRVFFPANMPYDAVTQFRQAWTGRFDDWHPPLMAVVLHLFLKVGRNIGALTLVQCLAGLLGVRALALAWLQAFYGPRFPPLRATWIALAVTLVLMVPVTPLVFYLTTFWKDSWAAFLLVWMCALAVRVVSEPPNRLRILALLAMAAGLGLVRHNAVVVLPVVGLVLWSAWRRTSRSSRKLAAVAAFAGWTLAPVAAFVLAEVVVVRTFDVRHAQLERHLVAFDLVGVCALDEEACDDIPVIQEHLLVDNVDERYVHGNIVYSFWTEPFILDPAVYWHGKGLASAYLRTAWSHPVLLAQVKLRAFSNLLGFVGPYVYYYQGIVDNEFGLRPNPRFAPVRDRLAASLEAATRHRVLRLVSMAHWVWILACLLWIVALAGGPNGPGEPGRRPLALVLLLPLAFYLSYLASTPAGDYRFLYPSTLVMQTVTLAALLGRAALGRAYS